MLLKKMDPRMLRRQRSGEEIGSTQSAEGSKKEGDVSLGAKVPFTIPDAPSSLPSPDVISKALHPTIVASPSPSQVNTPSKDNASPKDPRLRNRSVSNSSSASPVKNPQNTPASYQSPTPNLAPTLPPEFPLHLSKFPPPLNPVCVPLPTQNFPMQYPQPGVEQCYSKPMPYPPHGLNQFQPPINVLPLPNTNVPPPNFRPQVPPPYYPPSPIYHSNPMISPPYRGYPNANLSMRPPRPAPPPPGKQEHGVVGKDTGSRFSNYTSHPRESSSNENNDAPYDTQDSKSSYPNRRRSRSKESYRSNSRRSRSRSRDYVHRDNRNRNNSERRYHENRSSSRYGSTKPYSHDRRRSSSRERRRRSSSRSRDRHRRSRSHERRRSRERKGRESQSRLKDTYRGRRSKSLDRISSSSNRSQSNVSHSSSRSYDRRSPGRGRDRDKTGEDTRREELIEKWRRLNCKDDEELEKRLVEITKMNSEQLLEEQSGYWIRSAPANTYYERDISTVGLMKGTPRLEQVCNEFQNRLIERGKQIRIAQADCLPPPPVRRHTRKCQHHNYDSCSSNSDDEEEVGSEESQIMEELQRKMQHPFRLHRELWYNEPGEMNDGPLCKCSVKARRSGIRHGIYAGETPVGILESSKHSAEKREKEIKKGQETDVPSAEPMSNSEDNMCLSHCDPSTNNSGKLFHYRITISPPTNFLSKTPTIINHDGHEFIFSGFSLFSHYPLPKLPVCKVIRFNIEYIILYAEESYPENFTIRECDLFFEYLFGEILELLDLDLFATPGRCPVFHFMPRFVRELKDEGHELLPMCLVLKYLMSSYKPLVPKELLSDIPKTSSSLWQDFADAVKGMIVTKPGMKPSSIRVDQLDKDVPIENDDKDGGKKKKDDVENDKKINVPMNSEHDAALGTEICTNTNQEKAEEIPYPEIIHFGIRPPQLSYAGNQDYQKAWREYVKHRHLIANLAKPSTDDKQKLAAKEAELQKMRTKSNMKRDVTATVSSEGFFRTGLMCDVVQHAMLIPVLACHLRFHRSLNVLEDRIGYVFKNRSLLQLALTHPSYRENFGTNPDHARNSLTNCGIRQPEYGDRRIHYMSTKKRGINTLMNIMSRFGSKSEEESNIYHNERLEFLGDAVVEFVSTIHLFHMFRDLEEGGLATYRAALVQNQHLAVLAKVLSLDAYLLYAHGSDLCHDLELNHALANCFEALMGALFLDGAIDVADRVFGQTVFGNNEDLLEVWEKYPPHPLQDQEPDGDRRWIEKVEFLKTLAKFEESIGVEFTHIRLLARAFTDRSVGYTNLTLGSNQRLEFLGDSVLQLVASEYLYKHFPDHHEGHLSLLRSSLVNNNTQSVVCDDLGMTSFARYAATKGDLKVKDKADLLEAFLGALYIDKGSLVWVEQFCMVCFFPRLQDFIMNQEWNDPKSKLQQCCLTLRTMDGGEPDIPCYKVVECKGPTNTRTYSVAVYFRGKRLSTASGHSIQQAEMNAAQSAMQTCGDLFPQLDHQKRVIAKHLKTTKKGNKQETFGGKRARRCETPERYKIRRTRSRESRRSKSSEKSRSKSPRRRSHSGSRSDSSKPRNRSSNSKSSSPSPPRRKPKSSSRSSSGSPISRRQKGGRNASPPEVKTPGVNKNDNERSPNLLEGRNRSPPVSLKNSS